jgi:hypothetical protein
MDAMSELAVNQSRDIQKIESDNDRLTKAIKFAIIELKHDCPVTALGILKKAVKKQK